MIYMEDKFGTKLRCDCRLGQSREMLQVAKEKSKNIVSIVIRISEVSEWQVNDSVSDCRSSYEGPGSRDKLSLACLLSDLTFVGLKERASTKIPILESGPRVWIHQGPCHANTFLAVCQFDGGILAIALPLEPARPTVMA